MSGDVTCTHGTLLAAWCPDCASEWTLESMGSIEAIAPPSAGRGQSAA